MCLHCLTAPGRELAIELIDQILEKRETIPYEKNFLTLVLEGWLDASRKGVRAAVEYLNAVNVMMSHEDVIAILGILRSESGTKLAEGMRSDLLTLFDRSYKNGKTISVAATGLDVTFSLIDETAVNWLTDHHAYWIGNFFDKQLSGSIATTVTEGMTQGLGRKEIGNLLENFFEDYPGVPVKPSSYWRGLAANAMNRSRNFGLIGGYQEVGIKQLEIVAVMDERTCFPANTIVRTDQGDKKIENVGEGDSVVTHTGKIQRVKGLLSRKYSGKFVKLKTSKGTLVCSANHQIYVGDRFVPAGQLKKGDKVACLSS